MPQEGRISARDLARQLPFVAQKLPSLLKGYYYYALLKPDKALAIGDIIERNANAHGDCDAVLYRDRRISYQAFNAWANRFAHYFRARGIARGDVIAFNLENRPELLAALAGALKLGAAGAMINTSLRGDALAHCLRLTRPKLIVVGEEQLEAVASAASQIDIAADPQHMLFLADADTLKDHSEAPGGYVDLGAMIKNYPDVNPVISDHPLAGDTAVYLFTSGTTGLPKAAPSSHRKWFKAYGGFGHMSLALTEKDVVYAPLPLYHGTGLLVCWGAALAGASAIAIRRKFSASEFWSDVRLYRATCFGYVGELCRYLLAQPPGPQDRHHNLRKMIGNGLRPSIWSQFKERFGIEQIAELYAASEGNVGFSNFLNLDNTVGFSTAPYALVKFHEGSREPVRNNKGKLQKVSKGEPGLLLGKITPRWNFEGYTQPEATEKAIIRNAFRKGDAWFNTGDVLREIGWRHLQFVDRMGDTFRWKGENVSTTEVENALDKLDDVEEAVVYGVEIPNMSGKAGMAAIVAKDKQRGPDMRQLAQAMQEALPAYAIPVFIRVTPSIAKTGTFKYRKVDLQKNGYQLNKPEDQVYLWAPETRGYRLLTQEMIAALESGGYRL
ncbi:Acyl-CoA synthetases (AMP-forming)/AMP-acid ligases II [Hahella chejuensis KCTC 2396]|uniref:Acyl-CoA synthetases (AMP-forming)/AMP-acid ligases II n=1 Tax=Hahella chejuensis (strain KCTC 2396) TaxID=349521 RepID=Q2SAB9_HAHCH|nr:long-chain-acyl-CoA synthetase [Hahella chejuensis]ABC32405.1 Acyl-CoA synthetases (AMP-forming)/AMP-acid ligases II [Hahella chejuensis KCTC 2396]